MRLASFAAAALLLAAVPAAAQRLGARTAAPATIQLNSDTSDDLTAQITAAAAHPLGTLANPVRVAGPVGAHAYLGRLRCANGQAPTVGTSRSAGADAYGSLAQAYGVDCGAAAPGRVEVIMDLYFEDQASTDAPAGFTLAGQ